MVESKLFVVASLLLMGGCSKSPLDLVQVTGTVKYADGTAPVAEYRLIRFEPIADAAGHRSPRAASAEVRPDGTFQAMTLRPGDGMMAGDYKIVLLFWKSYLKRDSVLPPHTATPKRHRFPRSASKQGKQTI